MNRLCSWIKPCVTAFHELTADIFSSSYLVDCFFCFQIEIQPSVTQHIHFVLLFWIPIYLLEFMQIWGILEQYVQDFHSNITCLLLIYFSVQNFLAVLFLLLYLHFLHSWFVYWNYRVLVSCAMIFLWQNHLADAFSLFVLFIWSPWVFDFLLNTGLPGHFSHWHILIGNNWLLIGTSSTY